MDSLLNRALAGLKQLLGGAAMDQSKRIEAFITKCARQGRHPDALLDSIQTFLEGNGTINTVGIAWNTARSSQNGWSVYLPHFGTDDEAVLLPLDTLGKRLFEVCEAAGAIGNPIAIYANNNAIDDLERYLRHDRGWNDEQILDLFVGQSWFAMLNKQQPTALGRWVLNRVPKHFDQIMSALPTAQMASTYPFNSEHNQWTQLTTLLMTSQPPYVEQAIKVVTAIKQTALYVPAFRSLLSYAPDRFMAEAHHLVLDRQHYDRSRERLLWTMMETRPQQQHDLLLLLANDTNESSHVRLAALAYLVKHFPDDAASVGGTMLLLPNTYEATRAVREIKRLPFEKAQPLLERAAREGEISVVLEAVSPLLAHSWPGRDALALELAQHRSKQVRQAITSYLVGKRAAGIDMVAPLLQHKAAVVRETAADVIGQIGGETARSLLIAHLDTERSKTVIERITDLVNLAPATAPAAPGDPIAAAQDDAEKAMKRSGGFSRPTYMPATPPTWTNGEPVPEVVLRYLMYRQSRTRQATLDEALVPIMPLIDRASAAPWARQLWQGWLGNKAEAKESWVLALIGACADDDLIQPMRQQIEVWLKGNRGLIAAQATNALAQIGSDRAMAEIDDIAHRVKHAQVRSAAENAFVEAARKRGVSTDDLSDQIVPHLGMDASGIRTFSYGSRQFVARLQPDLSVQVRADNGKTSTTLPKPLKNDDAELAAAAQAEFKHLKTQLKQVYKLQIARLERALVTQRDWDAPTWQALFVDHPLLRQIAATLVWGLADETGGFAAIFRPLEDGTLTDQHDDEVALPEAGRIRLLHPIELDDEAREAWEQHLSDYEITPPFPQIDRPVVRLPNDQRANKRWSPHLGTVMNGAALKGRSVKAGWEHGAIGDNGAYYLLFKSFPQIRITAALETAGMSIGYEQGFNTAIKELGFTADGTAKLYDKLKDDVLLRLGDVPPVVFSEAAADVQQFASAGQVEEDWESKVW